ncbi:MAG: 5-deoxy-glucuronate isomerase [Actinobacteria bacterium]|nr:MAG: 5-deoxy-glucuronate isomerase [Actinomycetota bacterium]
MSELLLRHGEWDVIDPKSASWQYLSFRVERLRGDDHVSRNTGGEEVALVPLGGRCAVESDGLRWELGGRASVFEGMPWALYLPRDTEYMLSAGEDVEVAAAGAVVETRLEPRLVRPEDVEIEVRGSGNATRQINHIIKPEFPAQRLLIVEVFTPAGNWSSYPPHKHDEDHPPGEVVLEEVYYYRTQSEPPGAFAVQRLYSPQYGTDLTETVRDGDIMLVPHGYHTTAAAHGYDLYYLNGLAGDRRSMAAADDPELAWIRPAWEQLEPDPRVPLVTLEGRRS